MDKGVMNALELRRVIKAPRALVFEAWTRPEHMRRWSCPEGAVLVDVESDARPGGSYKLVMDVDGDRHTAFGTYREVRPPERLVYTWDWREESHAMGETLVTVEFHEVDEGTEVVLAHEGFPAPEATQGHSEGWTSCLDRLETLAGELTA